MTEVAIPWSNVNLKKLTKKPANDTRDQKLNYANNTKWNTNHNKLLTKKFTLVSNRSI